MALARARRERGIDYWPGFVDALSTLILGIVFLLSVFVVVQFFLSQEITGKETAINRLNDQIAQLTELLSLEKVGKSNLDDTLAALRSNLASAEAERDRLKGLNEGLNKGTNQTSELSTALDAEKRASGRALAQVELLNQQIAALRRQLAAIEGALEASENKDKEAQARIADLGQRLNLALPSACRNSRATARNSSAACARSSATGPTSAWSATASCSSRRCSSMPARRSSRPRAAPSSTSSRPRWPSSRSRSPPRSPGCCASTATPTCAPIASAQFPSNWELSAARAISVVQYMISKGVSPQRLVAAGFGEFQPLDTAQNDDAYRRNRRIELKLTER